VPGSGRMCWAGPCGIRADLRLRSWFVLVSGLGGAVCKSVARASKVRILHLPPSVRSTPARAVLGGAFTVGWSAARLCASSSRGARYGPRLQALEVFMRGQPPPGGTIGAGSTSTREQGT
jgi:hypothetical protein